MCLLNLIIELVFQHLILTYKVCHFRIFISRYLQSLRFYNRVIFWVIIYLLFLDVFWWAIDFVFVFESYFDILLLSHIRFNIQIKQIVQLFLGTKLFHFLFGLIVLYWLLFEWARNALKQDPALFLKGIDVALFNILYLRSRLLFIWWRQMRLILVNLKESIILLFIWWLIIENLNLLDVWRK